MEAVVPDLNLSEVSAAGTITTETPDGTKIEEFVTEEGGLLAVPFGEHLIGGHLIVHKYNPGPPPSSIFAVALGDGQGGRWEGIEKAWYAGEELPASPDGIAPGYHFHPGAISMGLADPVQPVDSFLPSGLAYSGTAVVIVKLPEAKAVEDRPDKLRVRAKCRWTTNYGATGEEIGTTYLPSPARVAADRIRRYYEQRYYDNPALAYRKFRDRIDWSSWVRWRDFCAENIPWDDGSTVRSIARFECHVAFTEDAVLADVLDEICGNCATFWQDDGERYRFVTPLDRVPVHHFHDGMTAASGQHISSNIKGGSLQLTPRDIRDIPNFLVGKFRNLDDPFLAQGPPVEVRRDDLIKKVGVVSATRQFANCTYSQAQRLLARQMRLEAGFPGQGTPVTAALRGLADSLHVLPGDTVTVSHRTSGWSYQRCLVLAAAPESAETAPDETDFIVQKMDGELYSDLDHTPIQPLVAP